MALRYRHEGQERVVAWRARLSGSFDTARGWNVAVVTLRWAGFEGGLLSLGTRGSGLVQGTSTHSSAVGGKRAARLRTRFLWWRKVHASGERALAPFHARFLVGSSWMVFLWSLV